MKIHVLNGDSLAESFSKAQIMGVTAVCRECLVEGDLHGARLEEFWESRERYLNANYPASENSYREKVVAEFEKLSFIGSGTEINLWFGHDLFCQVNLWFCLSLIPFEFEEVYRVFPKNFDFGEENSAELEKCFSERKKITPAERKLAVALWQAFRFRNTENMTILTQKATDCFPNLPEIGLAAATIDKRPREILQEIMADTKGEFEKVFVKFSKLAPIYGFGDSQVKKIYEKIEF